LYQKTFTKKKPFYKSKTILAAVTISIVQTLEGFGVIPNDVSLIVTQILSLFGIYGRFDAKEKITF